jgi:hypothetical protein
VRVINKRIVGFLNVVVAKIVPLLSSLREQRSNPGSCGTEFLHFARNDGGMVEALPNSQLSVRSF